MSEKIGQLKLQSSDEKYYKTDIADGDRDWEEDFYILRKSWCPAVLTENFFMDCKTDLAYLLSVEGKRAVVTTHVEGIIEWLSI